MDKLLYRNQLRLMWRHDYRNVHSSPAISVYNNCLRRHCKQVNILRDPQLSNRILSNNNSNSFCVPFTVYGRNAEICRYLHLGQTYHDNPSSKVEVTVQSLKVKEKEKAEENLSTAPPKLAAPCGQIFSTPSASGFTTQIVQKEENKPLVLKKSLKTRIWEELVHYYHGFRLLFIDINVCRKLLWLILNGKTLTRRENNLLVRTTSDLFRLIPFSVFIIIPFMELLLPLFIKFFPGMLPSTFQTAKERENKLKQSFQMKLEMAKFLQKTLDEMSVQHKEHKSEEAKQFAEFFRKVKDPNEHVSHADIIKFVRSFEDEITLDSLSREQLTALCRVSELNTMGTTNLLRFQLRVKLRSLAADDRVIAREGVNTLDLFELQQACKARGMRAYGLTADRLRTQLQEWIDLSLTEKIPPTLLLLSRALLISDETTTTTDKLKQTIRELPDSIAAKTKASIGEREGKIDNKTKIEVIKEEERKIKEEREEEHEVAKTKADILLDKAPSIALGSKPPDVIHASAPSQKVAEKIVAERVGAADQDKRITSQDVALLSDALKSLSDAKKMAVEKETIKDLKEELKDYKEDVEELHEVRTVVKEPVHESRAAKNLFKKVNRMIGKLDKVLEDLEKKHHRIADQPVQLTPEETELQRKDNELVRIDELVNTIKQLRQTSDQSRLEQIENVLSKIDSDNDGVITIDEVLKVVEAIARENVHLTERQVEELITLLDKEQLLEAEDKIEKAIAKSIKEAQKVEEKKAEQAQLMAALDKAEEQLIDKAPKLKDKATDLNEADQLKEVERMNTAEASKTRIENAKRTASTKSSTPPKDEKM